MQKIRPISFGVGHFHMKGAGMVVVRERMNANVFIDRGEEIQNAAVLC